MKPLQLKAEDLTPFLRFGEGLLVAVGVPAEAASAIAQVISGGISLAESLGKVELVSVTATGEVSVTVEP